MTEEKNMTRREIREQVFKMLFRVEFYNQEEMSEQIALCEDCLLYTSPSPRDAHESRMPSSA